MTTGAPGTCCAPLGAPGLSDDQAEATARVFKALADPHRVRIVNLLATSPDPVCVCEFTGPLGLSQPTVSHHLKKLVAAGLLEREQRGTEEREDLLALADLIAGLPELERRVMIMRFFHDLNQSAIAARIGYSQMHVSRLLRRALARMRVQPAEPLN